jgi:RNA polymerase sigma-70 factor (ECF subfamily)
VAEEHAFHTTRWTLVNKAHGPSPEARDALQELCGSYYSPVVAFLRREGRDDDAARELAHEFFARVLAAESLDGAQQVRGRFAAISSAR